MFGMNYNVSTSCSSQQLKFSIELVFQCFPPKAQKIRKQMFPAHSGIKNNISIGTWALGNCWPIQNQTKVSETAYPILQGVVASLL